MTRWPRALLRPDDALDAIVRDGLMKEALRAPRWRRNDEAVTAAAAEVTKHLKYWRKYSLDDQERVAEIDFIDWTLEILDLLTAISSPKLFTTDPARQEAAAIIREDWLKLLSLLSKRPEPGPALSASQWQRIVDLLAEDFREAMRTIDPSREFGVSRDGPVAKFLHDVIPYVTGEEPEASSIAEFLKEMRRDKARQAPTKRDT